MRLIIPCSRNGNIFIKKLGLDSKEIWGTVSRLIPKDNVSY